MKGLICCTKEKNTKRISVVGSEKTFKVKNWVSNRLPRLQLRVPSVRKPATPELASIGRYHFWGKTVVNAWPRNPLLLHRFSPEGCSQDCTVTNSLRFFSNNKGYLFEDFNGMKSMVTLDRRIQWEKECRFLALRVPQLYNDCLPMTHK